MSEKNKNAKNIESIYPISPMQEGMLFYVLKNSVENAYFGQAVFNIEGNIDIKKFEESLKILAQRYEIFRTRIVYKKIEKPVQVVLKKTDVEFLYKNLCKIDEESKRVEALNSYIADDRKRGFDITNENLVRISIIHDDKNSYKLIWSFHHIILDGWCVGILAKELFELYNDKINGKTIVSKQVVPYKRFIDWLQKQDKDKGIAYWSNYLNGLDNASIIPESVSGKGSEYKREEKTINLDLELSSGLMRLAKENNVTINTVFMAVWGLLLQKYNYSEDIVFGNVVSGRPPELDGIERMIGLFINSLPVRIKCERDMTFDSLLKNIQDEALESDKYSYCSLAEIQKVCDLGNALVNHLIVFENYPIGNAFKGAESAGFKITNVELFEQTNYDFCIDITQDSCLKLHFVYNSSKYDGGYINKIGRQIKTLFKQVIENSKIKIEELSILEEEEKKQILSEFNNTTNNSYLDKSITELFKEQVEKNPNKIALVNEDKKLTYKELDERSDNLARVLLSKGINSENIVGLIAERSIEMVTAVLGILKAGGAYLPIDPKYPLNRINYMLEDAKANIVLTMSKMREKIEINAEIIEIDDEKIYKNDTYNVISNSSADSLAYIMYTSGTTNMPKGVMVEHKNIIRLVKNTNYIDFKQDDKILQTGSVVFDASTFEIWGALLNGLQLNLVNNDILLNANKLKNTIREKGITILWLTSSLFTQLVEEAEDMFEGLRYLLVGGDVLSCKHINKVRRKYNELTILNVYGPTENTTFSTYFKIEKEYEKDIPIGKPITNSTALVLDKYGNILPIGIVGELSVGGAGVARGYLNSPNISEEKFVMGKFDNNQRIYKTGDLAKLLPDGNIEFIGRIDHQIKIRGYRVELNEIQNRILMYSAIKEAVVLTFDRGNNDKYICAYITSEEVIDTDVLKEYLSNNLPYYMVPTYIIQIEKFPLTINGKIDKKALPSPNYVQENTKYEEPTTDLEKNLVQIWQDTLGIEKISTSSNFFQLGGDSIKAMKMVAKAEKKDITIALSDLYEYMTIKELANHIDNVKKNELELEISESKITNNEVAATTEIFNNYTEDWSNINEPFSLTDIQFAYLMGRDPQFELGGFSTHYYAEFETEMDIERFNISLNKVIERHPMLRAIILPDGKQKILEEIPTYKVEVLDLTKLSEEEKNKKILLERERMSHYMFKTDTWPLFEFKVIKLTEKKSYLCFGMDVLIVDGASFFIIANEITELYKNPDVELPQIDFLFRDYVLALQDFKSSSAYAKHKEYWTEKLETFPAAPALPLVQDPAKLKRPRFNRQSHIIEKDVWERIKKCAQENNITPSGLLCTAYSKVLSHWSNQNRFAIDLTVFNRYPFHKDVLKLIGDFTSIILVDIELPAIENFWDQARAVQKSLMQSLEHRYYDGVEFIRDISRHNNMGTKAVMPVIFTCALFDDKESEWVELAELKTAISQTPQVYLDNQTMEISGELSLVWDYPEGIFDENTIKEMFEQYVSILRSIDDDNQYKLELSSADSKLIQEYNSTRECISEKTLHELFMEQVKITPNNIAVMFENQSITYLELDNKSNQVARFLVESGIKSNDNVGILAKRSIETIINIIGVLKAGGAYVPINPEFPEERRQYILNDSNCNMLLEPEFYNDKNLNSYSCDALENDDNPNDVAYIIYTSGSTGRPKGVIIKHKAAANTIIDINNKFEVGEKDRIIGLSSMCFDLSVYDIFGALSTGASLVLVRDQRNAKEIIDIINSKEITFWNSVPAIMDMIVDNLPENFENISLKSVLLSGDWISLKLPDKIKKHFKNSKVVSLGGATEASIWSIYYPINEVNKKWTSIPYGTPLANQKFYVLNFDMKHCPVEVPGELYIGGEGIAEGYINDEDKTNEAFINHPSLGRLYKTGDYGVMKREGYIEFLGRKDQQVKIRGYRIELGEIETVINQHDDVEESIVNVYETEHGVKQLVGYIIPKSVESVEGNNDNIINLDSVKDIGMSKAAKYDGEFSIEMLKELNANLERLSTAYIYKAVDEFRVLDYLTEEMSYEEIAEKCKISDKYKKLFRQWIDILVEDGILSKKYSDIYIREKNLPEYCIDKYWCEMKKFMESPDIRLPIEYLKLSGDNHIKMLRGEVNPLNLFFPKGSTNTADSIYKFNPIARYINGIAQEMIKDIVSKWNLERPLRILEIGAGTGGTTASLLPVIDKNKIEYTFTDLSTFFTSEAQEKFREFKFIKYGLFDINEEPQSQGYEYGYYDIIIGANVLHDAKNIDISLNYLKNLMTGEGLLILLEGTKNTRQQMVSVSFIEGLSHFEDERLEDNRPLLSVEKWENSIRRQGFGEFEAFPKDKEMSEIFANHVMIAKSVPSKKWLNVDKIKLYLMNKLPEYMIPSRIINIERLSLTSNGKIDKKSLPKPYIATQHSVGYEEPRNDMESKLAKIWAETIGVEKVGIKDNFFELGGDSLKAIQIVSKAEKEGIAVSLADMYSHMNIEELVEVISKNNSMLPNDETKSIDNLILLKSGDVKENNLFFVHAGSGEIGVYVDLCNRLENSYYCWALSAKKTGNIGVRNITLEGLAAEYINKIRMVQPHGPYRLVGWCVGGTIAFEMARQLEAMNEKVDKIVLINSNAPNINTNHSKFTVQTEAELLKMLITEDKLEVIKQLDSTEAVWNFVLEYLEQSNFNIEIIKDAIPPTIRRVIPNVLSISYRDLIYYMNLIRTLVNARDYYVPSQQLKAPIYFIEAKNERIDNKTDWELYSENEIEYFEANGNHVSIFEKEGIKELSLLVNNLLK